ncbi:MAG: serine/threonine protein kinase [Gammaproteobacteria bacterium]|nr:serine/threonine protein kinase [Gammaproteobacteria bacterium]MDH3749037.1 serine/threonine protein kinase [Gammaproteobacteria bacterium]MDH3806004.1 serine/threonine protein kinase [Gammaproteobacteria bacterium]
MQDIKKGSELASRYTLLRKLGAGGAAETWLAKDRLTRASVALKILVSKRVAAGDFHKEWQNSIRLMHAHIVRVFEFNAEPDNPFYSLQFVDGPDISVLSGAPLEHILAPVGLVADALRYAHGKNVVHRDIKASNILLDQNGAPYLIDFGVAAVAGAEAGGGSLIAASPQTLSGDVPQPADDIFALGGLIYELVSGRSPYSSSATAEDIRHAVPPPLVAADGSAVPTAVQQLVASMLDKDALARPDAATVATMLESAGFPSAPAPASYTGGRRAPIDELIEASDNVRPGTRHAAAASLTAPKESSGISPRTLGISLVVLLAILTGVVFFLPDTVTTDGIKPVAETREETVQTEKESERKRGVGFTENVDDLSGRDARVKARADTEVVLGELLSKMETLERRAVQRWGGLRFKQAQAIYAEGDVAYLARDYVIASEKYAEAIAIVEPLLDEVDQVFATTFTDAQAALEAADAVEALRLFELAVAISPSHAAAEAGYTRAKNLDTVLSLTDQGFEFESELELEAARQSFARAVELDPEWQPAQTGLERVQATIKQMEFDQRMTEGLTALTERDYPGARAAFRMAQQLRPESREPADGLLQVDQGIRLDQISAFERQAQRQERDEEWEIAVETYESILEIDSNLLFAQEGLSRARQMTALHAQLDEYIADPDSLSTAFTMSKATRLVVDITRMPSIGPRLSGQRDELSRLLKRAATPLTVQLVSDNVTDVSIYKVGKLGSFQTRQLDLRPGTYVAVGSRPGYRDVRLEFRVAPEIDLQPVVVRCEESI